MDVSCRRSDSALSVPSKFSGGDNRDLEALPGIGDRVPARDLSCRVAVSNTRLCVECCVCCQGPGVPERLLIAEPGRGLGEGGPDVLDKAVE